MIQEPEIKLWTAKRRAGLTKQIMKSQTTAAQAASEHDLTASETQKVD